MVFFMKKYIILSIFILFFFAGCQNEVGALENELDNPLDMTQVKCGLPALVFSPNHYDVTVGGTFNTDIYLVDTYGETKKFFKIAKMIFIGGSIVNHGGQNPIEPARYGLSIVHGPNVRNFKDIFKFFKEF